MYMGVSPKHSSTVPLVLNLDTGHIGVQYHAVFDDWFKTVSATMDELPNFNDEEWYETFGTSMEQYIEDDESDVQPTIRPQPALQRPNLDEALQKQEQLQVIQQDESNEGSFLQREHEPSPIYLPEVVPLKPKIPLTKLQVPQGWHDVEVQEPLPQRSLGGHGAHSEAARVKEATAASPRASSPQREKGPKLPATPQSAPSQGPPHQSNKRLTRSDARKQGIVLPEVKINLALEDLRGEAGQHIPLLAYKAKAQKDPDTFNWDDAMASEHKEKFLSAT
jgi:hypothetical protein